MVGVELEVDRVRLVDTCPIVYLVWLVYFLTDTAKPPELLQAARRVQPCVTGRAVDNSFVAVLRLRPAGIVASKGV